MTSPAGQGWAGWAHYPAPWGVSVVPVDDVFVHDATGVPCACGPAFLAFDQPDGSASMTALHHSLDGRERGWLRDVHIG